VAALLVYATPVTRPCRTALCWTPLPGARGQVALAASRRAGCRAAGPAAQQAVEDLHRVSGPVDRARRPPQAPAGARLAAGQNLPTAGPPAAGSPAAGAAADGGACHANRV